MSAPESGSRTVTSPTPASAARVAAVPYDVVNAEEALALAHDNPLSFLHVSRAEIDLPPGTNPYSDEVYAKAAANLAALKTAAPLLVLLALTSTGGSAATAITQVERRGLGAGLTQPSFCAASTSRLRSSSAARSPWPSRPTTPADGGESQR